MFAGEAFRQLVPATAPVKVLDCCAAPGGKSTHLAGLLHPDSLLVCNEVIRSRVPLLTTNLDKWGYGNTAVTAADPEGFSHLTGYFDVILVDAPCSGEGLFRKDHGAISEWSAANANLCALRQDRILSAVWPALKEGGLLIYSTCTWNPEEDEENISRFALKHDARPEAISTEQEWGIECVNRAGCMGYKFYPHLVQGEGFFLAALRKTTAESSGSSRSRNAKRETWRDKDGLSKLLRQPERFTLRVKSDVVYADPTVSIEDLDRIATAVPVLRSGLALGTARHGKITPEHSLALSLELDPAAFPTAELSEADALRFLRKDTLSLNGSGTTLVTFQEHGLGWVNILPGRVNNLLPMGWRIRM